MKKHKLLLSLLVIACMVFAANAEILTTKYGYLPFSKKEAISTMPAEEFVLVDAETNRPKYKGEPDEPLIDPKLVDALAVRMKDDAGWAMATAACPIRTMRDLEARTVVKVVLARDGGALYFSRLPIPCRRDGEPELASGLYLRHLGIYAYRGSFLKRLVAEPPCALEQTERLEQLRALYLGGRIAVIQTIDEGVGVDTPEDVPAVEAILRERTSAQGQ